MKTYKLDERLQHIARAANIYDIVADEVSELNVNHLTNDISSKLDEALNALDEIRSDFVRELRKSFPDISYWSAVHLRGDFSAVEVAPPDYPPTIVG